MLRKCAISKRGEIVQLCRDDDIDLIMIIEITHRDEAGYSARFFLIVIINERKIRGCYWGLGRPGIGGGAPVFGRLQSEEGKIETINSVQINLNNIVRDRKGTWKTINLKETSSNANHMQGERCRDFVDFRLHDCKHILIIWGVQQASNLVISIDQVQRRKNKRPITLRKLYHY